MTRQEFPKSVRVAAFKRADKRCEECTAPLFPSKYRYDHILPLELGGKSTLENCQVICLNCDSAKTYGEDIPRIAKARRMESKHIGAKVPKGRPFPGSRNSPWRKKMSGEVVRR